MSTSTIISIVCSLLSLVLCFGFAFFLVVLVVGVIVLRRRGKKVTAREAVSQGVESVSMVFRKDASGNLEAVTSDGSDDDEES